MLTYVLLANKQADIEFQYADFSFDHDKRSIYFDYNKKRIGLIKILDYLNVKDTKVIYHLLLKRIFTRTIDTRLINDNESEYCFIVMARTYEKYGPFLIKYLREHYPRCKIVLYLTDLIRNMRFSVNEQKDQFDIICSFDECEAKNNNMYFVLEPFSTKYLGSITKPKEAKFDVSFVGAAKGRYKKILMLFNSLTSKELKCDFYIVGVDAKDKILSEGLHYDEWLDFKSVLEHAANSRCIIELMQPGGYSATTRFAEAVLLKKNLITDCPALQFSSDRSIHYFSDQLEISAEDVRNHTVGDTKQYIDLLSISTFVKTIEKHLLDSKCDD